MKDETKKKGFFSRGWVTFVIIVTIFVGARLIHPGGIKGIITDFFIESNSNSKTQELRDEMLESFIPIGAAMLCMKKHGKITGLENAIIEYNNRNESEMKRLISDIEALGGLSKSEKDLLDRMVYSKAEKMIGLDSRKFCLTLAKRFDSGEFDIQSSK
ncbi:MAG: hypothetical protein OEY19_06575 [Gammaproteobacteria bacterium]|nr:hypothetical protein [Gammaproteobacteria bacterium]MDH5629497.1 hypothetical protein [Gammaproteobacteria bacterium]